ncbi:hypothetical protein [Pseudomonas fluorescens]|uniref:hypothetical protein n=1 Tax=Pseudomonas fluorescens TaxID=294 RepID=UPI003D006FC3
MTDQPVNLVAPSPILTPREIKVIKTYVRVASGLSTNFEQMNDYWGNAAIPMNYEEITNLYGDGVGNLIKHIVKHAEKWPDIEADLKNLCLTTSENFKTFTTLAVPTVKMVENLPGYIEYSRTLQQQVDTSHTDSFYCPLCAEDLDKLSAIETNIDNIKTSIERLELAFKDIDTNIMSFKKNLMNNIQTDIDSFVKLDTATEMVEQLNFIPMEQGQRMLFSGYMGVIRGLVLKVIKTADGQPVDDIEAAVTAQLDPNHVRDYDESLSYLPDDSRSKVNALIMQTKKGQVLSAQLESLHDWLKLLDQPLTDANKGVGQVRTLWRNTTIELDRIKARITQVTLYSELQSIVRSLNSALAVWQETDKNSQTLNDLLERSY